jgi:hypothetical protein
MRLHVRGEYQELLLGELLPHKNLAGCTQRYQVEGRFTKIDAD